MCKNIYRKIIFCALHIFLCERVLRTVKPKREREATVAIGDDAGHVCGGTGVESG